MEELLRTAATKPDCTSESPRELTKCRHLKHTPTVADLISAMELGTGIKKIMLSGDSNVQVGLINSDLGERTIVNKVPKWPVQIPQNSPLYAVIIIQW
jgi:hypothetical protein